MRTVFPTLTTPLSTPRNPASTRSSVVFPLPFTPTSPMRSPGPTRHVTSSNSSFGPKCK